MKTKRRNGFIRRLSAVCIIGIALLFAFSVCDDGGGGGGNGEDGDTASFAGTWNASGGRSIVFSGSTFNYKVNGTTQYSGTFSVAGSKITFNATGLGTAGGSFSLSGTTLTLSNHTWDASVNGTYTKEGGGGGGDTASFAGTWNASGGRSIVFTGTNFNYKVNGTTKYSGTFSVSGSTITFNESSLGTASGSFSLSGTTLTLSNHTWDNSVNGTYTKDSGGGGGGNASTYIITGSGTTFTATKNGTTVGTANQTISSVITAIRTDANGANCTIQFGNGTTVLDNGANEVYFSGTWGNITLTGKIKSSGRNTLNIGSDISANINSTADIENTDTTADSNHYAINNSGKGTLIIDGGTVSSTGGGWGNAITSSTDCSVIVNGGTVLSTSLRAILNSYNGTVTINGGTIESRGEGPAINSRSDSSGTININGGTVTSTSVAIRIESGHTLNITNGVVKTTSVSDPAINNGGGVVTISGGTVSKTLTQIGSSWGSGTILSSGSQATLTISGGTVSISTPTGTTTTYSSADAIDNGSTLTITGGTISASGHNARALANQGTTTITGGTLTATGSGNVYTVNNIAGTTTITSPPTVIDKTKTSGTITWKP